MDFIGKLGKYKILKTEDNTQTVWSEYFDEACHNLAGAYEETLYNYIHGCKIPEQISSQKNVHVLDVGFGVGLGLKAFIDEISKHTISSQQEITYTSMELDEDLFLWSVKTNFPELSFVKNENAYACKTPLVTISVLIGDGRLTIPEAGEKGMLPKFTAIFQDAFSPNKNRALWTVEWFGDLKNLSDQEVYLSTYSASVSIRKSLIISGWSIENAKGFGQKRTMTKARLIGVTDPLIQAELSRSPALELRDI